MISLDRKVNKDNVPTLRTDSRKTVSYALSLTSASSGSGVRAARKNTFLKQ
ncbi:MAG: hypothetical protein WC149_08640 [Arcobacteraceae bacterium]